MHARGICVCVKGRERLRDRIDAALGAFFRAERLPVVIVAAAIPCAVPRGLGRACAAVGGKGELPGRVPADERGKFSRRDGKKPRQPHALAAPLRAHAVEGVVPVAGADAQQAVRAHAAREHAHEGAAAVLEHRAGLRARGERLVAVVLVLRQLLARKEGIFRAQDLRVAGLLCILAHRPRQPQQVVRDARAHAVLDRCTRVPPVAHVPGGKLVRARETDLLARRPAVKQQQVHRVLKLVAEAERAAVLVQARARHQPAAQRLIRCPAAEIAVHGGVRRRDPQARHRAQPPLAHPVQRVHGLVRLRQTQEICARVAPAHEHALPLNDALEREAGAQPSARAPVHLTAQERKPVARPPRERHARRRANAQGRVRACILGCEHAAGICRHDGRGVRVAPGADEVGVPRDARAPRALDEQHARVRILGHERRHAHGHPVHGALPRRPAEAVFHPRAPVVIEERHRARACCHAQRLRAAQHPRVAQPAVDAPGVRVAVPQMPRARVGRKKAEAPVREHVAPRARRQAGEGYRAVGVPAHIAAGGHCPPVARRGQQRQRAARVRHAGADGRSRRYVREGVLRHEVHAAGCVQTVRKIERREHPAHRCARRLEVVSAVGGAQREVAPDAERAQQRPLPQHVRLRSRAPDRQVAGDAVHPERRALQLLRRCIRRGGRKQQRRNACHRAIKLRVRHAVLRRQRPRQRRRRLRRQHKRALRRRERIVLVRAHTERKAHAPRRVRRRVHRNAHLHIPRAQPAGDRPLGAKVRLPVAYGAQPCLRLLAAPEPAQQQRIAPQHALEAEPRECRMVDIIIPRCEHGLEREPHRAVDPVGGRECQRAHLAVDALRHGEGLHGGHAAVAR